MHVTQCLTAVAAACVYVVLCWACAGMDYHPDGTVLASCSFDGLLRLWDVSTGHCLVTRAIQNAEHPLSSVHFSPTGEAGAQAGEDTPGGTAGSMAGNEAAAPGVSWCSPSPGRRATTAALQGPQTRYPSFGAVHGNVFLHMASTTATHDCHTPAAAPLTHTGP